MISSRTSLAVLLLLLAAAFGLRALPVGAEVYRYVDDDGRFHFSDSLTSIPPRYRDQVSEISEELHAGPGINVIPARNQGEEGDANAGSERNTGPEFGESFDFETGGDRGARTVVDQLWDRFGVLLIVGMVLVIALGILLAASILMLACKLAAPETPGYWRLCAVVFVQALVGMGVERGTANAGLALGVSGDGSAPSLGLSVVSVLLSLAAYAGVLSAMTDLDFPRALWVESVYFLLVLFMIVVPIAIVASFILA